MTHYKTEAKQASEAKMKRMGLHKDHKTPTFDGVHAWDGLPGLNSGNAGQMPVGKQRFKRGGKVANIEGQKAHQNLGKKPRRAHRDDGGAIPMPPPRPFDFDKVPLPPRKDDDGYNTMSSKMTKKQMADQYSKEHPNEPSDLTSRTTGYAAGGVPSMNPAKRKAIVGAIAGRKKKAGIPGAPPAPRGPMMQIPAGIGASPSMALPHKKGGKVMHPDEAEDKKLVKQMVKPSALRKHRDDGGAVTEAQRFGHARSALGKRENLVNDSFDIYNQDPNETTKNTYYNSLNAESDARKKFNDSADQAGYRKGGRAERKSGGRVGKTNINIIMQPSGGQQQPPAPPMPPVVPPVAPPMAPPMGAGAPQGGPAANLPPQIAAMLANRGAPMARKSGGRVGKGMPEHQEKDFGSGSGLGRLVKKKWPPANGTV